MCSIVHCYASYSPPQSNKLQYGFFFILSKLSPPTPFLQFHELLFAVFFVRYRVHGVSLNPHVRRKRQGSTSQPGCSYSRRCFASSEAAERDAHSLGAASWSNTINEPVHLD